MSFTKYLKEEEEAEVQAANEEVKAAITALFTTGEKVTDEAVHGLAEELEMEHDELEEIIYQMMTDLLTVDVPEEEEGEQIEEMVQGGDDYDYYAGQLDSLDNESMLSFKFRDNGTVSNETKWMDLTETGAKVLSDFVEDILT